MAEKHDRIWSPRAKAVTNCRSLGGFGVFLGVPLFVAAILSTGNYSLTAGQGNRESKQDHSLFALRIMVKLTDLIVRQRNELFRNSQVAKDSNLTVGP